MKDIKKTKFMEEAALGRGHSAFVEICIAVVLFFAGSIAMWIVEVPAMFIYLFGNKEYMSMLMSGSPDMEKLMQIIANVPEWVTIAILASEALFMGVVLFYCRIVEKRKLSTLGFVKKGFLYQYMLGLIFGAAAFSAAYLVCVIAGGADCMGASDDVRPAYIIGYLGGFLIQGMAEEVFCRGYFLVSLSKRYHVAVSILANSVFFACLHQGGFGLSMLSFLNLILFGIFASLLFIDCQNIWIVGAFHGIWNFMQGCVYGVGGADAKSSVLVTEYPDNRGFLNGGVFGMDGGIAVTLVLLLGVAIVYAHLKKRGKIIDGSEQPSYADVAMENLRREMDDLNAAGGFDGAGGVREENMYSSEPVNMEPQDLEPGAEMPDEKAKDAPLDSDKSIFDESYFKD